MGVTTDLHGTYFGRFQAAIHVPRILFLMQSYEIQNWWLGVRIRFDTIAYDFLDFFIRTQKR